MVVVFNLAEVYIVKEITNLRGVGLYYHITVLLLCYVERVVYVSNAEQQNTVGYKATSKHKLHRISANKISEGLSDIR